MAYSNKPVVQSIETGKKAFCSCGESNKKPFCDGSHPKDVQPTICNIEETKNYAVCDCGLTAKTPFCDGAHSKS